MKLNGDVIFRSETRPAFTETIFAIMHATEKTRINIGDVEY
jgi:hypothetical protein